MNLIIEYSSPEEQQSWEQIIHTSLNSLNRATGLLGGEGLPPIDSLSDEQLAAFQTLTSTIITQILQSMSDMVLNQYRTHPKHVIQMINRSYMSLGNGKNNSNDQSPSSPTKQPLIDEPMSSAASAATQPESNNGEINPQLAEVLTNG